MSEPASSPPRWRAIVPGVGWAALVAVAGILLSRVVPLVGGITLAIVLGILVGNVVRLPVTDPGVRWCEKTLLSWAVALLGLGLSVAPLRTLGVSSLAVVVGVVALTLLLGPVVARLTGLTRSFGVLLGVGSAICGASAIAAAAPLVSRDRTEIGISIGVVNLLGTVGIFLLPPLVARLGLDASHAALLIGGSLQAVGHVVAAGFIVSDAVGEVATAVKMFRILLLGPVVLGLGLLLRRVGERGGPLVPGYIVAFLALAVVGNLGIVPDAVIAPVDVATRMGLTVAMAAVGLRIELRSILVQGPRAVVAGILLFAVQLLVLVAVV
jgi:uncharacterized integral membrane protein (TIGR00698 family)